MKYFLGMLLFILLLIGVAHATSPIFEGYPRLVINAKEEKCGTCFVDEAIRKKPPAGWEAYGSKGMYRVSTPAGDCSVNGDNGDPRLFAQSCCGQLKLSFIEELPFPEQDVYAKGNCGKIYSKATIDHPLTDPDCGKILGPFQCKNLMHGSMGVMINKVTGQCTYTRTIYYPGGGSPKEVDQCSIVDKGWEEHEARMDSIVQTPVGTCDPYTGDKQCCQQLKFTYVEDVK